jgi:hypothetical protein
MSVLRNCGLVLLLFTNVRCVHEPETFSALPSSFQTTREVSRQDPMAQHTVVIADPDPRVGAYCTAVVLSPQVLMSSARCFGDKDRIPFAWFERSGPFGEREDRFVSIPIKRVALHVQFLKERREKDEQQFTQAQFWEHPSSPTAPAYDLALALLAEPVPEPYTAVTMVGTLADLRTSTLVQAGYGCAQPICEEDDLQLHQTPVQLHAIFPQSAFALFKSAAARGTCRGDLGGPYFQVSPESVRLVAMSGTSPELCEAGTLAESLVAPFQVWIEQAVWNLEAGDFKKSHLVQIIDFEGKP